MDIREYMRENTVILDGGMGTLLQSRGLMPGERSESWNLSHPDEIIAIHQAYFDAGSNVICTNTFGANCLHYSLEELKKIITAAVDNAKAALRSCPDPEHRFIALDIGPTGRLLSPMGDLDFEDAVACFAETVRIGVACGVDLIMIETMNDSYETKAALLAAKENSTLPVFVSNAYSENGTLMTGASAAVMVAMLEGMGADAIGVNCSYGPDLLAPIVREYLRLSSVPVLLKPNAGLPQSIDGKTVYSIPPERFADTVGALMDDGVRIVGGCCGTTPDYIRALCSRVGTVITQRETIDDTIITSYAKTVCFTDDPVLIGERINPTGKKRLKEALRSGDIDYILNEAIRQQNAGAHVLDVNVGLPEIDEPEMLEHLVCELQSVTDLPLQIDTSDPIAMERALRRYNGKPMLNSVNGKQRSMDAVFPLMKKYGGVAVALTLDEDGIPDTVDGRVAIARKIISVAESYGIDRKDLVFDTLAMAVSADRGAALVTLESLRRIRDELHVHTSLGVSNISFGLPDRDIVNASFFLSALSCGLSAAIMNPFSVEMMKAYYAYRVLHGLDENCGDYIDFAARLNDSAPSVISPVTNMGDGGEHTLRYAITKGMTSLAATLTQELLRSDEPMAVVQEHIIPALDAVGSDYEKGAVYLPQLLMAAESAKAAFEEIKRAMPGTASTNRCRFVIATVKGDIHDIGKNIVRLLLENYGFEVHDLGKDVDPQLIVDAAISLDAPVVGLSALMTSTVPAMEETIRLLRQQAPSVRVVVGGAVLTQEYADAIGADQYCKDAMDTVRYAEWVDSHRTVE